MKYIHTISCRDPTQTGFGIPTYRGIPYQDGYGVYQGQVFQRGHGLGGILGALFRTTIRPALKTLGRTVARKAIPLAKKIAKQAIPAAKRVGKVAAKRAAEHALNIGIDAVLNKKNFKQSIKSSAKTLAKSTLNDAIKEAQDIVLAQTGSGIEAGLVPSRKRKRQDQYFTPCKKSRRTIYD